MFATLKSKLSEIKTPCYIMDEKSLINNLSILENIQKRTGCKILLAQKAFSMFSVYPLIAKYLSGTTASGLYEARLGYEEMGKPFGKETHVFAPAFLESEIDEILSICDHIVFNSFAQWEKYKSKITASKRNIEAGIRINPEYSEIETDIYNPCIDGSRLGVRLDELEKSDLEGISGIHFHTMCEQGADTLKRTIEIVDEKFGAFLQNMKWINFGGGHHITKPGYDVELLIKCINHFQNKYNLDVYIEPGEAIALNAGYMVTSVLDIIEGKKIDAAIIDASPACHMPDVIEMPYRPVMINGSNPYEKPYTYRFGGNTCLAGDILGDYSFDLPLNIGDKLILCDMAIYSMVKNNTFNGMALPSICLLKTDGEIQLVKEFSYEDFKGRLS